MSNSGAYRSENARTSNRKHRESRCRRKTKGSFTMIVIEGLVGSKPMAKAAGDVHKVNIP